MMHNLLFYTLFLLFIVIAGMKLLDKGPAKDPYRGYLLLLLPSFLMVLVGVTIGIRQMPRNKVVVHGYRTPLTQNGFTIGSDVGVDDVRFYYRFKNRETISPGILHISREDQNQYRLTQTDPRSPNIIRINGKPLRSLQIEPGKTHLISFGALGHSQDPDKVLQVTIKGNQPVFRFRNKEFTKGFTRELAFGLFSIPYEDGKVRHLGYGFRIQFPGLNKTARELLGQASIFRSDGMYWLAANDADIRLNGAAFPNSALFNNQSLIQLSNLELGLGRREIDFKVRFPRNAPDEAFVQLVGESRKEYRLPEADSNNRVCLTAGESYYSQTHDIRNTHFPLAGTVINREGGGFVFRGEILQKNKLYSTHKGVFSIDDVAESRLRSVAWLGLVFLVSALFVPPAVIRREPKTAVVLGAGFLLLAFRLVLAFRAWQGPPFKESTLMDSLIAPYLFTLLTMALTVRGKPLEVLRRPLIHIRNFFAPGNRKLLNFSQHDDSGLYFLALVLYGGLVYQCFKSLIDPVFPALIALGVVIALLINVLEEAENRINRYASAQSSRIRWSLPAWLLPIFIALILAAPVLGGKEVISILPGRPRPDIFIQLLLLFLVAYFASIWEREARYRVPNPLLIIITFSIAVVIPFIQGVISRDMGFFVMTALPLILVLICVTWRLDQRIRFLLVCAAGLVLLSPLAVKFGGFSLDEVSLRRIAFFVDEDRVKAEYFFDYLAHLPILWASQQGLFGGGFFHGDWYAAIGETSVNDNVASVFIQGELGAVGSILIISICALLALAPILFAAREEDRRSGFQTWFLLGTGLMLIWTSATMFLANLGYFPLTGKNLPFLGVDSMNDVIRYGLISGFITRYMTLMKED